MIIQCGILELQMEPHLEAAILLPGAVQQRVLYLAVGKDRETGVEIKSDVLPVSFVLWQLAFQLPVGKAKVALDELGQPFFPCPV